MSVMIKCPLCPWQGQDSSRPNTPAKQHALTHSTTLPRGLPIQQKFTLISELADEALATSQAANPGQKLAIKTRSNGHPIPRAANVHLTLQYQPNNPNNLLTQLAECSRIIWENLTAGQQQKHPQPAGKPQWDSETAWLSQIWPFAQTLLDKSEIDWIDQITNDLILRLAPLAGRTPKPLLRCPDCGAPMHSNDNHGDYLICESGQHRHPGAQRLEKQWRRKPPLTIKDIATQLDIPEGTLKTWQHRRKIRPAYRRGRTAYFLPWDVLKMRYPDIMTAIDRRDMSS